MKPQNILDEVVAKEWQDSWMVDEINDNNNNKNTYSFISSTTWKQMGLEYVEIHNI